MGTDTPTMTACPHCGAAVRPGAPFCTLCHADFRPPPPVAPAQSAVPLPSPVPSWEQPARLDPLTAPLLDVVLPPAAADQPLEVQAPPAFVPSSHREPTWPCTACGSSNVLGVHACVGCGTPFLAAAREQLSVVVPGIGDLVGMSRGQRMALAAGVALAFAAVVLVLGAIFS